MHKLSERNVLQKVYFFQDLARFLQVRKILQCHCIQESSKNAIASKNLARIELFVRILQDVLNLQEISARYARLKSAKGHSCNVPCLWGRKLVVSINVLITSIVPSSFSWKIVFLSPKSFCKERWNRSETAILLFSAKLDKNLSQEWH